MLLNNGILALRAPEPEDLELLYQWENMPEYWDTGNTRQPYSRFALKEYISNLKNDLYIDQQLRLMMVATETGETVGTLDLFDFDLHHSRIALGLFVAPEQRGKGYARMALRLIEEYVFRFLKIHQLYCHISLHNNASIQMFESEHFSKSVLRQWIKTIQGYEDIVVFQQFATDFQSSELPTN